MSGKLYRCSNEWEKIAGHPCWRVQKALDQAGVEYELVRARIASPTARSSKP